jgi:ABC-2 type transport system ATP-binding protein
MPIIETQKLTRRFGTFTAVDALDLAIEAGEAFALLGPNGAGKSTVIKMLTTLLPPSSGEALIGGFSIRTDPEKVRSVIGYVPQMLSVDGTLTGMENLMLFARLYNIPSKECKPRVLDSLTFMGLLDVAHKPVHTYSGGMIRRLEIAQSMLHRPKVLFLDEPTVGLDPIACKTVWEHIIQLKATYNTTILMTTHLMDEAELLCNRIAFMSQGQLITTGTPQELKDSIGKPGSTLEDAFIHYIDERRCVSFCFRRS